MESQTQVISCYFIPFYIIRVVNSTYYRSFLLTIITRKAKKGAPNQTEMMVITSVYLARLPLSLYIA